MQMTKDKLRSINTHFWIDSWVEDLDPIEKLLFLYLITNPYNNLSGVYELKTKRMAYETGIDKDTVEKILERFAENGKAYYFDGYVYLPNFQKHQRMNESMKRSADKYFDSLPKKVKKIVKELQPGDSLYTDCIQTVEDKVFETENVENEPKTKNDNRLVTVCTQTVYKKEEGRKKKEERKKKKEERRKKEEEGRNLVLCLWNDFAEQHSLTRVIKLSKTRIGHIKARLSEDEFDMKEILKAAEEQSFLLGANRRRWKITFDWIIGSPNNYIKILERQYSGTNREIYKSEIDIASGDDIESRIATVE